MKTYSIFLSLVLACACTSSTTKTNNGLDRSDGSPQNNDADGEQTDFNSLDSSQQDIDANGDKADFDSSDSSQRDIDADVEQADLDSSNSSQQDTDANGEQTDSNGSDSSQQDIDADGEQTDSNGSGSNPQENGTDDAPALFATAIFLDGEDDSASAPDSTSFDVGINNDDFTIETFFYVPDLANNATGNLIWKQGAYGLYIIFSNSSTDRLIFRIYTGVMSMDYVYLLYEVDLSVGWHHVASVFDNEYTESEDLIALYLDGSLVSSGTAVEWTPGIPNSSSALYVGAYIDVNPFVGWIEELRISDIVRYSGPSYTIPTLPFSNDNSTRALWHFDEVTGSTEFTDESGNGNTLSALNGAATGNL